MANDKCPAKDTLDLLYKTFLFSSGDQGSVENEYAYIDRAKLATFAHSEYSMARSMVSQFHDLAPYASTDILRQAQARVTGQPPLYQVNIGRVNVDLALLQSDFFLTKL